MGQILIIDDEAGMRQMLRTALEDEGHEVMEAPDGETGQALFRDNPTDVIITDMLMPGKEGIQTIRELLQDSPEAKIIAISGGGIKASPVYLSAAEEFGAFRTFQKPFNILELVQAIEELINAGS